MIREVVNTMNDDDVPLFHELGEGVDPKDLEMTAALSGSTTTMASKKRGVRGSMWWMSYHRCLFPSSPFPSPLL
jgi:hypothetical protein